MVLSRPQEKNVLKGRKAEIKKYIYYVILYSEDAFITVRSRPMVLEISVGSLQSSTLLII